MTSQIIGRDSRNLDDLGLILGFCGLDAAAASISLPAEVTTLDGLPEEKMLTRSKMVADEVIRLANSVRILRPSVACFGAIGSVITHLRSIGIDVTAYDLHPELIGNVLAGVTVQDGNLSPLDALKGIDVAVVTGMTVSTLTATGIMDAAKQMRVPLVFVAQSAAHLLPLICSRRAQSTTVLSEQFPLYLLPGQSTIATHRRLEW
jgi:hypothetical protein